MIKTILTINCTTTKKNIIKKKKKYWATGTYPAYQNSLAEKCWQQ